jgi:hypothetical protein
MEPKVCPKTEKCPIFNSILRGTEFTETYKKIYCEAGEEGRSKCRRYQVAQAVSVCPPNILPNSSKTVNEIIQSMKEQGIIK